MLGRKHQQTSHDNGDEISVRDPPEGDSMSVSTNMSRFCAKNVRSISKTKPTVTPSNNKPRVTEQAKALTITSLPNETILDIIKMLHDEGDSCTATCLGLMVRRFYPLLKIHYPQPIPLYKQVVLVEPATMGPGSILLIQLANLLHGFMGRKYRLGSWYNAGFLNKDVYGEVRGHRENMLEERWEEYWKWGLRERSPKRSSTFHVVPVLPCPRGMGEPWYEVAEEFVEYLFSEGGEEKFGLRVEAVRGEIVQTNFFKRTFYFCGTLRIIRKKR